MEDKYMIHNEITAISNNCKNLYNSAKNEIKIYQ